ncbi:MAG: Flp pilus assembly protein CpaB [Pseudobdellovibrio sp.]
MGPNESRNLWISIGAGVFATFLLYSYSQEKKAEIEKSANDKVKVVVAREDIREMDTIYDNVLEVREVQRTDELVDYFDSIPSAVGGVAAIPIKKGQIITKNAIVEVGPETGLAIQVSPGKRPVTIPVSPERANANLIRPGDRVDVYAVIDSGRGINQKREVSLFSQDVTVLATGVNVSNNLPRTIERDPSGKQLIQTTLTGDTKYSNITLEVKDVEVQDIVYLVATNPSSIILVLRNPNDRKNAPRLPASSAESIQSRTSALAAGSSSQVPANLNGNPTH